MVHLSEANKSNISTSWTKCVDVHLSEVQLIVHWIEYYKKKNIDKNKVFNTKESNAMCVQLIFDSILNIWKKSFSMSNEVGKIIVKKIENKLLEEIKKKKSFDDYEIVRSGDRSYSSIKKNEETNARTIQSRRK